MPVISGCHFTLSALIEAHTECYVSSEKGNTARLEGRERGRVKQEVVREDFLEEVLFGPSLELAR